MNLIAYLLVGLLAGWLACMIRKRKGIGLLGHLVVGVLGSMLGGFLLGLVGLQAHGFRGSLVTALVGALILLSLLSGLGGKK